MEDQTHSSSAIEQSVTMVDVLQEEEELQQDADAVLGAGDDTICTFDKNPKRQALYACITCCPREQGVEAGICLGCSYHCHDGHNLIELYTKRNFKCDCGNSKFGESKSCKLFKDKPPMNKDNSYNQNFFGNYCICARPYPDPEDKTDDAMLQCIICEDWYHGRHLNVDSVPNEEGYEEMVCPQCIEKFPFLLHYSEFSVSTIKAKDCDQQVAVSEKNDQGMEVKESQGLTLPDALQEKNSASECKLVASKPGKGGRALFFTEKWRSQLCSCDSCKKMYIESKLEFLPQQDDTVTHYEEAGKTRSRKRSLDDEMDALSSLDRVTRTEMVCEFNDMSTALHEYLRTFAESRQVVTEENIRDFFANLTARKKQKTGGMSYFCK